MNTVLYGITALLLILSYQKDKGNTKTALKKAWKAFENILPEFMTVLVFLSMTNIGSRVWERHARLGALWLQ